MKNWRYRLAGALMLALAAAGCGATYPLGMSAAKWASLNDEQQAEVTAISATMDRYAADENRCRREAEMKMKTRLPVNGPGSAGTMTIALGVDRQLLDDCLRRAGWTEEKIQPVLYWMKHADKH